VSVLKGTGHSVALDATDVGAPAIDLGGDGPTANDPLDVDDGPNGLLNYPEVRSAWVSAVRQGGYLASADVEYEGAPNLDLQLVVYAVETCRGGERPRSVVLAGTAALTTNAEGWASRVVTGVAVPADASGLAITATDDNGSTSELSGCAPLRLGRVFLPVARTD
jgi:hypothetical protein